MHFAKSESDAHWEKDGANVIVICILAKHRSFEMIQDTREGGMKGFLLLLPRFASNIMTVELTVDFVLMAQVEAQSCHQFPEFVYHCRGT